MDNLNVNKIKKLLKKKINNIDFSSNMIVGFASQDNFIYPFGTDSKIIGRIFEVLSAPILQEIAKELNLKIHSAKKQNLYPDFWFTSKEDKKKKIAVDIKSTYREYDKKGELKKFKLTLGSFGSFLRDGTKNIEGNYSDYIGHLIIGFIYTRNNEFASKRMPITDIDKFIPPFKDVEIFVAEKYKISGDKPGSGNTENIGTIKTNNINNLKNESGPFSILGEDAFNEYWRNYPRYRQKNNRLFENLDEYISWKLKNNSINAKKLNSLYKNLKKQGSSKN